MSSIYFHSPSQPTVSVSGRERAAFGLMATEAMLQCFGSRQEWDDDTCRLILGRLMSPPDDLLPPHQPRTHNGRSFWWSDLRCHLSVQHEEHFRLNDGSHINTFSLSLNQLIATGSDPVILAARLHGQCEVHAWVAGKNRKWLAGIIKRGLASGIYRPRMGLDEVIALLLARNDEPVVTSYSVCRGFPNPEIADFREDDEDAEDDVWYSLPEAEQWERAFKGLQALGCELYPQKWRWPAYWFGDARVTASQVAQEIFG